MSTYQATTALLSGVIDYAGIFPPAKLPLNEANKKAATFRRTAKHPWLMGRITLPWEEIKKLTARTLFESGADGSAWNFTALAASLTGNASSDLMRAMEWELREIRRWNDRWQTSSLRMSVVGYEIKLPVDSTHKSSAKAVSEYLYPALDRFPGLAGTGIVPYFEISFEANWKEGIHSTCTAIADWIEENTGSGVVPGVKFRTGGELVPTPDQLAEAIVVTTNHRLKFKATQGLHHPFSDGKDYGFINLLTTLALSQSYGKAEFSLAEAKDCLVSKGEEFHFHPNRLEWRKRSLGLEDIENARRVHAATFGSCSVDAPDQYLTEEGL